MSVQTRQDELSNPFAPEPLAAASIMLLCKAMRVDVKSLHVNRVVLLHNLKLGEEITVKIDYHVVDASSGVGAHEESGTITMPLLLMGQSDLEVQAFRIPQRVIRFEFVSEELAVCWGDPSLDGYVVWFSSSYDGVTEYWTTCSDYSDSEPAEERMTFVDGDPTTAVHPEAVRNPA